MFNMFCLFSTLVTTKDKSEVIYVIWWNGNNLQLHKTTDTKSLEIRMIIENGLTKFGENSTITNKILIGPGCPFYAKFKTLNVTIMRKSIFSHVCIT